MKIKVCLLQLLKKLTALMLWVFVLSAHAQSVPNNAAASVPAGTLIQTDKGLKPIETFVGGELVWSRSDQTGQFGFKPVMATKATPNQEIFAVEVQNAAGDIEVYETTSEHPFWLKDEGWRKASLLEAGMVLVDRHDEPLTVLSMKPLHDLNTVFNIQVHEFETYHVGELGTWVHNAPCCDVGGTPPPNLTPIGANRAGAFNQAKRDAGVPVSAQPTRTGPNLDRNGKVQPGSTNMMSRNLVAV